MRIYKLGNHVLEYYSLEAIDTLIYSITLLAYFKSIEYKFY